MSNEEIVVLLGEVNQGVQGLDSEIENDMPPMIPHKEEEESVEEKLWAKACADQEAEEAAQAKCRFDAYKKTRDEDLQKTREEVEEQEAKTKCRFEAYKKARDKKREEEEEKRR